MRESEKSRMMNNNNNNSADSSSPMKPKSVCIILLSKSSFATLFFGQLVWLCKRLHVFNSFILSFRSIPSRSLYHYVKENGMIPQLLNRLRFIDVYIYIYFATSLY